MIAATDVRHRTASTGLSGIQWTVRHSRWFLVALHLPFVAMPPIIATTASEDPRGDLLIVGMVAVAIGGLQLRHSLAAAREERPRHWPWTFLALGVLVYVPMFWLTWRWYTALWFVIGSAAMLLPRRLTAPIVAIQVALAIVLHHPPASWDEIPAATLVWIVSYLAAVLLLGGAGLFAAPRLVRVVDELSGARAQLAQAAIDRERLRISRDVHDLLGRSLSAVSLKGELALRLLASDPRAAGSEIASLTEVARDALRDVRGVTREHKMASFRDEIGGAASLLDAAGIEAHIDADLPPLPGPVDDVLGWAVREGVTNILRHSDADTCWITARLRDSWISLDIINDGASPPTGEGTGLAGLATRATALSGSVSTRLDRNGRFRLSVLLPQGDR